MIKVIILYNDVGCEPSPDDLDTAAQAKHVAAAAKTGYDARIVTFSSLSELRRHDFGDSVVFNLTEDYNGDCYAAYKIPLLLEKLGIPFTGCGSIATRRTCDKVTAKKIMLDRGLPTPPFVTLSASSGFEKSRYIVKPARQSGSVGIDESSVVGAETVAQLRSVLKEKQKTDSRRYFAEKYIDGREVGVSLLQKRGSRDPQILPPREIRFNNFGNKLKILDYASKWDTDNVRYKNTVSAEIPEGSDNALVSRLKDICLELWRVFQLRGYARVDFRIDREGNPYILEVNPNPCITPPDSGFILAAESAGYSFVDIVNILIENAEF